MMNAAIFARGSCISESHRRGYETPRSPTYVHSFDFGRPVLVPCPLSEIVTDIQHPCSVEHVCCRFDDIPSFHGTVGVPLEMRSPNAPAFGIGVIRRDGSATDLAATPCLVRSARYTVRVQPCFVRSRMAPGEVGRFEMHRQDERTSCQRHGAFS